MKTGSSSLVKRLQLLFCSFILCCIVNMSFEDIYDLKTSTITLVKGFSLNKTVSEKGVALQYNSHLKGHDPDNDTVLPEGEYNGVPTLNALLYLKNPNETKEGTNGTNKSDYIQPKWSSKNLLRVCMQYWDESQKEEKNFTVVQLRWVLNYTFPMKFANWTPQFAVSKEYLKDETIKDWCSRGHYWGGIIEENGKNKSFNEKKKNVKVLSANPMTPVSGGNRRLSDDESYSEDGNPPLNQELLKMAEEHVKAKLLGDHEAKLQKQSGSRFLQGDNRQSQADAAAQAPKAGDKGADDDDDAAIAQSEADAEAMEQASTTTSEAELPPPLFGVETLAMTCDLAAQVANVSFQMPFEAEEKWQLDLDWKNSNRSYKLMLNWGVFDNETDNNTSQIYGASYMRDAIDWEFLEPKSSLKTALMYTSMLLLSVSVLAL